MLGQSYIRLSYSYISNIEKKGFQLEYILQVQVNFYNQLVLAYILLNYIYVLIKSVIMIVEK